MKKTVGLMALVLAIGLGAAFDADAARRIGGGKSTGLQRQNTTAPAQTPPAGNPSAVPGQAAPAAGATAAAAGAAAKAPGRSWMGPIAGLAAGIGLMALASHFGFGEAMANMMMIGLLVMVVLAVIGFVMRKKMAANMPAMATPGGPMARQSASPSTPSPAFGGGSLIGSRLGGTTTDIEPAPIPAGFDTAAFERNAKAQFLALQEANDAGDLAKLRGFLTPEMYDVVAKDIAERGTAPQKTEAFGLQARVLQVAEEGTQYVVSVRFTGSVRDEPGAAPEDLDEVWHLTKPRFGDGGWVIAGIQQVAG